jgi:hypothetical protein
VHPDSIIDVFSSHPATNLYDSVPFSQRHRVILHELDTANASSPALQLGLQSQYRGMKNIDVLHIEDPDADQRADIYGPIKLTVTDLNPDVIITSRSTVCDKTMGSKLHGSMKYLVENPPAMISQRIYRCETSRTVANSSKIDSLSTQLEWLEQIDNAYAEYIDRRYGLPVSVGLFHYEDIIDIVMNHKCQRRHRDHGLADH